MVRTYEKKRLKQYTDYGFKLAVESVRTKHLTVHGAAKVFKVPYETLRGYILKGHHKHTWTKLLGAELRPLRRSGGAAPLPPPPLSPPVLKMSAAGEKFWGF